MDTAPASPQAREATLPAAEVARGLDIILAALIDRLWTSALIARLLGPLLHPIWTRISRTRLRLARALAHILAGTAPRPARPSAAAPSRRPAARSLVPNRRHGWLANMMGRDAHAFASQLSHLLAQPGVAETLAASPGAVRTLRPLCRMLGAALPGLLRLPAHPLTPRPPRPRPATPEPASPPNHQGTPDRPLPRYVLAAVRAWHRPRAKTT